ncbi:MAG TPA: tetratricopeptide repeat protein [Pyrinomonadaceae bacterium]|nr:tetratricopeptide repeat protein [Pyrinomonadaceae bacterium]
MKRCPDCRRDYYDDSLLFCLDDGARLLEGPASNDEPATTILSASSGGSSESATRPRIHTDRGEEVESQGNSAHLAKTRKVLSGRDGLIALLALAATVAIGIFSWRYLTAADANQISSIAVMPFVNESGNADVEYLSDGMTETLIRSLSLLPGLNVKARSTVFRYKGRDLDAKTIGSELAVQAILNGRVVQRGDGLSLNLELIDAQTENVIWTDQYDRKPSDLVSLQNEIARDVSSKLRLKLSGADQRKLAKSYTNDPEAYRLYLQGRFYWNKRAGREFEKSHDYFRQSVEKDPNFALGYVGLADYYGDKQRDKAKENVNRALALDADLAEAHGTLGYQYMLDYNWREAERHMKRALELDSKNLELHRWNGQRRMMLGLYDEALASYRRAMDIDPNSSPVHFIYGACLVAAGKLDDGIEYLQNAVKNDPTFVWSHSQLSFAYRFKNNYAGAAEERAIAQELLGETENARLTRESFAKGGRDGFLREMIRQGANPDGVTGGMRQASAYALLGEKENALAVLENLSKGGEFWLFQIKYDPAYVSLHGEPRFQALLRKFDPPQP